MFGKAGSHSAQAPERWVTMPVSSTTKAPRVSTGLPGLVSNSFVVRKREVGPICLHSHVPARPTCRSVGLTEVSVPSQKCPLGQTEP